MVVGKARYVFETRHVTAILEILPGKYVIPLVWLQGDRTKNRLGGARKGGGGTQSGVSTIKAGAESKVLLVHSHVGCLGWGREA